MRERRMGEMLVMGLESKSIVRDRFMMWCRNKQKNIMETI
jgi:hypothetical protein